MADNDFSIKFGADLGDLNKALASAAGSIDAFKKSIAGSVKIDTAGAAASTQALERALAGAAASTARHTAEIGAAFDRARFPTHQFFYEMRVLLDEFSAGRMQQFQGSLVRAVGLTSEWAIGFARAHPAIAALSTTLAAAGGALVYLGMELRETNAATQEFAAELAKAGNLTAGFRGELLKTAASFEKLREGHLWDWAQAAASSIFPSLTGAVSLSGEQARDLMSALASIPNVSNEVTSSFAELARSVRGVFGEEATNQLIAYAKQLADPKKALENISKTFADLTAVQRAEIKSTIEGGDAAKQAALAWSILSREFMRSQGEQILAKAATEAHSAAERERIRALAEGARASGDWATALAEASHVSMMLANATRKMQQDLEELRHEFEKPISAGALMAAAERLSAGTPSAQITKLTGDLNLLDEAARRGADSATELVKHFERFTPEAKWDVNHFRMGFGSDTVTDANGRVGIVLEGASTTIEDATRDLARRVRVTQDELLNDIGDSWARLPAKVKAVLTSVAYNYGQLPKDIAAAAKTENVDAISAAISKHASDKPYTNDGRPVNERRRLEEAAIVLSANEEHEARAKISDDLQKQRDIRAGGSAIDKAALETAREAANAGRDEVAARERSVAALEKQLNLTNQTIDRSKLETQFENERAALRQARAQKTAADANLKAAGTFQGTDEWEQYKLEAISALQAVTKQGTAEWAAYEEQKTNISRQAEAYRDSLAENALNRELQSRLAALKIEEDRIKEAAARKNLNTTEEIAALQSISDHRLEIQKAHYDKVAELYEGDKKKLSEIEAEKTRIVDQSAVERANIQKSLAAKQEAEGKAFADSVAGMSGSILRALQEHKSVADALRNSLRNMLTQAFENNMRVLAQMVGSATGFGRAFGQVMDGSLTKSKLTGQGIADGLQKPTEGVADGLQNTMSKALERVKSAFADVIQGMGSLLKDFLSSAASFVGSLFKGLGSIGGSLGSALPSFDVGSWSVPSGANVDGKGGFPALIHPGEMIVPALAAGSLRAALKGVGAGLGGLSNMTLDMPRSVTSASAASSLAGVSQPTSVEAPPVTVHNYAPGLVIKPEVTRDYVHIVVREAIAGNNRKQSEAERRSP